MEDRWLPEETEEVDLLVDLLDYVKSRWAPGHVPRVGLGTRVHPKQKREYALAFARSVDAAIARGHGHLHRSFPKPIERQDKAKALTSSPHRKPGGRMEAAASKQHRELERAAEKGGGRQSRNGAYGGGGDEMADVEEERGHRTALALPPYPPSSSGRKGPKSSSHAHPREVAESKGDASARVRFFDDKSWRPVECRIPWSAAKVGITVINHPVSIGGSARSVLFVSVVSGHGTGAMAGVQQGDCVVEVEGRDVSGLACRDLLSCLRDMLRVKRHVDPSLTLRFLFARSKTPATDWAKAKAQASQSLHKGSSSKPRSRPPKPSASLPSHFSLPRPLLSSPAPAPPDPSPLSSASPVPPSSSGSHKAPLSQTYSVKVDLGVAGRVTDWCRPVTSEKTGKRYYVVAENMEVSDGGRVKKGDILMTADTHEVAKNQGPGLHEVLSRLGGVVRLSFWTAQHKLEEARQEEREREREGEGQGDKGEGMQVQGGAEGEGAPKEEEQEEGEAALGDGPKSDSDRLQSDSEDNISASNAPAHVLASDSPSNRSACNGPSNVLASSSPDNGPACNDSASNGPSNGSPGHTGKGATRPREEGDDPAAGEGPTEGDAMENAEPGSESPSTSIRLKRQKSHHGHVVYSVLEGKGKPEEDKEEEQQQQQQQQQQEAQGEMDVSMTDASNDGDRVIAHRGAASGAGASVEGDTEASMSTDKDPSPSPLAVGDVVWARLGKLPRWPALLQELDTEADPPSARVKFFGDWQTEKVALRVLEPFEASFRKLFKKRYEKVYVQTVASAVQFIMSRDDLSYSLFGQRVGVWPQVIQKYMEEDALPKVECESVARLSRLQAQSSSSNNSYNSTSRTQALHKANTGGKKGQEEEQEEEEPASKEPRWKQIYYDIDPELFRETKKNGIKSEAWF